MMSNALGSGSSVPAFTMVRLAARMISNFVVITTYSSIYDKGKPDLSLFRVVGKFGICMVGFEMGQCCINN